MRLPQSPPNLLAGVRLRAVVAVMCAAAPGRARPGPDADLMLTGVGATPGEGRRRFDVAHQLREVRPDMPEDDRAAAWRPPRWPVRFLISDGRPGRYGHGGRSSWLVRHWRGQRRPALTFSFRSDGSHRRPGGPLRLAPGRQLVSAGWPPRLPSSRLRGRRVSYACFQPHRPLSASMAQRVACSTLCVEIDGDDAGGAVASSGRHRRQTPTGPRPEMRSGRLASRAFGPIMIVWLRRGCHWSDRVGSGPPPDCGCRCAADL